MPDDATKRALLNIHADYQFWMTVQGVDSPEAADAFARLEAACRAARVELASVSNESKKIDATIHESSVDIGNGERVSVRGNHHCVLLTVTSYEDSVALLIDRSEVEKVISNLSAWLAASRSDDGSA